MDSIRGRAWENHSVCLPEESRSMKTIGLIGGMSWESTTHYYQRINQLVAARLGGLHSASLLLWSVEFPEIARLPHADDWDAAGRILADAAQRLEQAGAEALLICANTMHRVAPAVEAAVGIPLLHLADITAKALLADGYQSAALLGTRFTMDRPFYRERLQKHGLEISVPTPEEQDALHHIIFDELVKGRVEPKSRETFIAIMRRMHAAGAQAVILGCTEFGMLLRADAAPDIPRMDTTELHCHAAVEWMLA
jgi:aspartate racemase